MLKFIVLGYVPGTSFQISFTTYLIFFAASAILSLASWYILSYQVHRQAVRIATIQLISL